MIRRDGHHTASRTTFKPLILGARMASHAQPKQANQSHTRPATPHSDLPAPRLLHVFHASSMRSYPNPTKALHARYDPLQWINQFRNEPPKHVTHASGARSSATGRTGASNALISGYDVFIRRRESSDHREREGILFPSSGNKRLIRKLLRPYCRRLRRRSTFSRRMRGHLSRW